MMTEEQIFNKRIEGFLKFQPDSSASILIRKIASQYENKASYYMMFDDFTHSIGMSFLNTMVLDDNDNILGYFPQIKYYSDNKLSETPGIYDLVGNKYIRFEDSVKLLAKEVVYRLMRINNLNEIL